jgi:hypothetical protein
LLQLTVNDILVLYRAIHAVTYKPSLRIMDTLTALAREEATRTAALAALEAVSSAKRTNPNILLPLDASKRSPRERLHPMTFSVPFEELNLASWHERSLATLQQYYQGKATFAEFDEVRRVYLGALADFGRLFSRAKDVAALGESASVGTIKFLAHLPKKLQLWLDRIPNRFEVLNDIIKGREVFSNIGAVVPGSTLTRFMTAKDDNEHKTLVWAVMTDANSVMSANRSTSTGCPGASSRRTSSARGRGPPRASTVPPRTTSRGPSSRNSGGWSTTAPPCPSPTKPHLTRPG